VFGIFSPLFFAVTLALRVKVATMEERGREATATTTGHNMFTADFKIDSSSWVTTHTTEAGARRAAIREIRSADRVLSCMATVENAEGQTLAVYMWETTARQPLGFIVSLNSDFCVKQKLAL
jgi:hypothetical protein